MFHGIDRGKGDAKQWYGNHLYAPEYNHRGITLCALEALVCQQTHNSKEGDTMITSRTICLMSFIVNVFHVSLLSAATCVPALWPPDKEKWTWHEDAGEGPGIHATTDIAFHDGTWYSVGTHRDYQRCAKLWKKGEDIHVSLATSADGLFNFDVDESINPIVEPVDRIGDYHIDYGDNRNAFFPCFGKNPDGTLATFHGQFVLMVISETKEHQTIHQCLFSEDMKHWTDRTVVEPLSSYDEPVHTNPVREPQSFLRDDDGTWYVYYVSHAGDRGDAQIKFASGPSPIDLTPSTFQFRDGKYECLDPVLLRDSQSWIVLYNSERAENKYLRIEELGSTDWEPGEDYFRAMIQTPTTTFAWAAIVNEAEESVTWRMYQPAMMRYSDKTIHSGVWETTVPIDKTVGTIHNVHCPAPHDGSDHIRIRPFSIQTSSSRALYEIGGRSLLFNGLGKAVVGEARTDNGFTVLNRMHAQGFRFVMYDEQGRRSCLPTIFLNKNGNKR